MSDYHPYNISCDCANCTRTRLGPKREKRIPLSVWNRYTDARKAAEVKLAELRHERIEIYTKR